MFPCLIVPCFCLDACPVATANIARRMPAARAGHSDRPVVARRAPPTHHPLTYLYHCNPSQLKKKKKKKKKQHESNPPHHPHPSRHTTRKGGNSSYAKAGSYRPQRREPITRKGGELRGHKTWSQELRGQVKRKQSTSSSASVKTYHPQRRELSSAKAGTYHPQRREPITRKGGKHMSPDTLAGTAAALVF
jgi:general stress protein YciG